MKKIDEGKCDTWCEMLLAIIRMAKELNDSEVRYIKAKFSIEFGRLELQKLENEALKTKKGE